jgi:acetyl-CoA acetyltransferase
VTRRNPAKDQVAIVGVGNSRYTRSDVGKSVGGITVDACLEAIRDSGLQPSDIDGICGSLLVSDVELQLALGLPAVRWSVNHRVPFGFQLQESVNAVFAGACTAVLVYHSVYRGPRDREPETLWSRSARIGTSGPVPWKVNVAPSITSPDPGSLQGGVGYASWAGRYLQKFGVTREETLGLIAINNRTNAGSNENAIMREAITIEDYLAARMVREPLGLLDMDIGVTGADAFIVTTADRARSLPGTPVYVHALAAGRSAECREDQITDLDNSGQRITMEALWARSDLTLDDVDLFIAYDGFTIINLLWIESVGFCERGEAAGFIASNWNYERNRLEIGGRVPMNTHGGNLSEGATQGSGALREVVTQLRGANEDRKVEGAKAALWTCGGIVWNASGAILHTG